MSHAPPPTWDTIVRVYPGPDDYQREFVTLTRQGWEIINVTERQPRPGILRILTLGLFTLVFPPRPELVVTYRRRRIAGGAMPQVSSEYAPEMHRGWGGRLAVAAGVLVLVLVLLIVTG